MIKKTWPVLLVLCVAFSCNLFRSQPEQADAFKEAQENGRLAAEGFDRCLRYVNGWLDHADPASGLIPKNISDSSGFWNAQDCAADNYPFMVLTAAMVDPDLFEGRMLDILRTEVRLTCRLGSLPDTYSFSEKGFKDEEPDVGLILFGASEYIKDGLLPITEWLGESPWSVRMLAMLDDMWKLAPIETPYGKIVSESHEINGEMLQVLSRVYWMTGDKKYLEWALRLGDYYLLGNHHPTRDGVHLRLRDHGCEIVSGLCELYATVHFAMPDKKVAYKAPLYEMLDCILEFGRNDDGLFYNGFNPRTGMHDSREGRSDIADTWGYTLNGYYTVFMLDKYMIYRDATWQALESLNDHYRNFPWEGKSSDGYADSIECAINLYNRLQVRGTAKWIDSEIQVMWEKQQPDGVIEGWHGDGNFARTTLLYCLWKTKGVTIRPWRKDVIFGAVQEGETLKLSIRAEKEWSGKILFDRPRHRIDMKLPLDWPRINQFPEWFTVEPAKLYHLNEVARDRTRAYKGKQLNEGVPVHLEPGVELKLLLK